MKRRVLSMDLSTIGHVDILWQCLLLGGLGSIAGLAALLRAKGELLTKRAFFAALLNSGLFAIGMGIYVVHQLGSQNLPIAIALSILAGLGGSALIDFLIGALKIFVTKKLGDD